MFFYFYSFILILFFGSCVPAPGVYISTSCSVWHRLTACICGGHVDDDYLKTPLVCVLVGGEVGAVSRTRVDADEPFKLSTFFYDFFSLSFDSVRMLSSSRWRLSVLRLQAGGGLATPSALPSLCVCPKWLCNCSPAAAGGTPLRCKARLPHHWPLVFFFSVLCNLKFCSVCVTFSFYPTPINTGVWTNETHPHTHKSTHTEKHYSSLVNSLMSNSAGKWTHAGPRARFVNAQECCSLTGVIFGA